MSTRRGPQAAVLKSRILNGKPKSGHRDGIAVQESGVLMATDFATNSWLLADVHRLQCKCIGHPDIAGDSRKFVGVSKGFKDWIEVVHRMSDFVDAEFFALLEISRFIESLFFEEADNSSSRINELLIGMSRLFIGCEHAAIGIGVKAVQDLFGLLFEIGTCLKSCEVGKN